MEFSGFSREFRQNNGTFVGSNGSHWGFKVRLEYQIGSLTGSSGSCWSFQRSFSHCNSSAEFSETIGDFKGVFLVLVTSFLWPLKLLMVKGQIVSKYISYISTGS